MMSPRPVSPKPQNPTGSPRPGEPEFLVVGKLGRPHGIHGEIAMSVLTDFPERIVPGMALFVGSQQTSLKLRSCRPHKRGLLVSFEGYDQREESALLTDQLVQVPTADRPPLPEGEYYHHQLLGLAVVDDTGRDLGSLAEILETGANDVYVVRSNHGEEILLPAIDPVILQIDLDRGIIRVHLLPGLIPEE
jgi:16S rRNA processing protein RimM